MEYRELGKTGLKVSVVGFGSAELGMDYGIKTPGEYGKPDRETAKKIIGKALDCGVNLFDTAPSYGDSESLLGSVIDSMPCYIATKINIPGKDEDASKSIRASIEKSLKNLRREHLDIVQIHNATVDTIRQSDIPEILVNLCKEGLIRFTGASVYESQNAMAVVEAGCFDVLQIAYNILDQRMLKDVIPEAKKEGIGILGRSVYLKGVLTAKVEGLSEEDEVLKNAVNKIKTKMNLKNWSALTELALRFCISTEEIDSALVGIRTMKELEFAVKMAEEGNLSADIFGQLLELGVEDEYWLNPANWHMS